MTGFRSPRTVLTESSGAYVDGQWVAGDRSTSTIFASVQPLSAGQDMESLPEGRRFSDAVKVFTDAELQATEDGEGIQPDLIVHLGYAYEIVSKYPNANSVIQHIKYIAVRSFKFTTAADWISGALQRV